MIRLSCHAKKELKDQPRFLPFDINVLTFGNAYSNYLSRDSSLQEGGYQKTWFQITSKQRWIFLRSDKFRGIGLVG